MIKHLILPLLFVQSTLVGCGVSTDEIKSGLDSGSSDQAPAAAAPADDAGSGSTDGAAPVVETVTPAKSVPTISDLPDCRPETYGLVVFVKAVSKFEHCQRGIWSPIASFAPTATTCVHLSATKITCNIEWADQADENRLDSAIVSGSVE